MNRCAACGVAQLGISNVADTRCRHHPATVRPANHPVPGKSATGLFDPALGGAVAVAGVGG
jgi:hypothetical protein